MGIWFNDGNYAKLNKQKKEEEEEDDDDDDRIRLYNDSPSSPTLTFSLILEILIFSSFWLLIC